MLGIVIDINPETGAVEIELIDNKREYRKRDKGKSLIAFPDDCIVIDIETTGLDPGSCEIIEFAGIKVKEGGKIEQFQTLIKPEQKIDDFIINLTGITNEMLNDAPTPKKVLPLISKFIGDSIIVAHNAHFDINFLYDYYEEYLDSVFDNDFICTMRLSRRIFPDSKNHKLITLCDNYNLSLPKHRAIQDAISVLELYRLCKKTIDETTGIEEFIKNIKRKKYLKASDVTATVDIFDSEHPLFGRHCVFTGTLSKMVRKEAMQLVVNLGGRCSDNVNKNTNYLVMGVQDYSKFADGQKSNKTKRAEKLILEGYDIEIISENLFYDLVLQEA